MPQKRAEGEKIQRKTALRYVNVFQNLSIKAVCGLCISAYTASRINYRSASVKNEHKEIRVLFVKWARVRKAYCSKPLLLFSRLFKIQKKSGFCWKPNLRNICRITSHILISPKNITSSQSSFFFTVLLSSIYFQQVLKTYSRTYFTFSLASSHITFIWILNYINHRKSQQYCSIAKSENNNITHLSDILFTYVLSVIIRIPY